MKMVVNDSERTWASYMPLAYFGFFWLQPIVIGTSWKGWLLTVLGTVLFVTLYFGVLSLKTKLWRTA